MLRFIQSKKKLELRISATQNLAKTRLLGSLANNSSKKTLKCVTSMKVSLVASGGVGDIGVFLLTSAVLEIVGRFCLSRFPFIWHGLQAAQILCCQPFKWIQKWAPFTKGMKTLSRPVTFCSEATGVLDESGGTLSDSGELSSELSTQDTRDVNEVSQSVDVEDWLVELYEELEKQGITIPERFDEAELRRFYDVSNGDFAKFLSSVKKTIQWRQTYTLLSKQELEAWGNLVFWHGYDTLVIRIGLASSKLDSDGQAQFVRAVVSQVEYGVVNLLDTEYPQLTVVLDCNKLSHFGFPIQRFRSCVALLQDHYPDRLGCLLVVRLPSEAHALTETLSQDLKRRTWQKLEFVDESFRTVVLSRYFKKSPPFPTSIFDNIFVCCLFQCVLLVIACIFGLSLILTK